MGVLVDATAAYPVAASLLGTSSWLQAERIEQRHLTPGRGLATFVRELAQLDLERLMSHPEDWPALAGLALVQPDDDQLAVRGRELGTVEDHTATLPVGPGSVPVWCGVPRVVASRLRTGRMPKLLEAYTFRPLGVVEGAKAVELPGGIVFDPRLDRPRRGHRYRDLPIALAAVGLLAKTGPLDGDDRAQAQRLKGGVKVARNVAAYGGPVEYNPSLRAHGAWGPDGKLAKPIHEEPGWLTDPVAGSLVVAGCELLLTLLEVLIERAGGSTAFVDTDAAYVPLSPDGGPITVEGRGADGAPIACEVGTLTATALVRILNRFGPIARSTGLRIPAQRLRRPDGKIFTVRSIFKVTDENLAPDDTWAQDLTCRAIAKKRYVLTRRGLGGEVISVKSSAHVIGTLANFRNDGTLDQDRIEEAWRVAPSLDGDRPILTAHLDLTEPVLQPLVLVHPRDWRALRTLRFSSTCLDGIRPFESVLVPFPLGRPRARLIASNEPDRTRRGGLTFRDPDGNAWSVRTPEQVGGFSGVGPSRVQVSPSLGDWVRDYMGSPEVLALGPDGEPCAERTSGPLRPLPVRVVSRRVGGQEPHRSRDEESVLGWDVQRAQRELGRSCRAPGCIEALSGRQRLWCERHRRYPGTRRAAWTQGKGGRT